MSCSLIWKGMQALPHLLDLYITHLCPLADESHKKVVQSALFRAARA